MEEKLKAFITNRYPGLVEKIIDPDKRPAISAADYIFDMQCSADLPRRIHSHDIPRLATKVHFDIGQQGARVEGDIRSALEALVY